MSNTLGNACWNCSRKNCLSAQQQETFWQIQIVIFTSKSKNVLNINIDFFFLLELNSVFRFFFLNILSYILSYIGCSPMVYFRGYLDSKIVLVVYTCNAMTLASYLLTYCIFQIKFLLCISICLNKINFVKFETKRIKILFHSEFHSEI